ncbi:MAG: UDP-N-acetylmuramoylalanyl-D-glutamyl-2,6-diaminopimelate--D-alanyl-D-alanine ligase [Notoacmeibacter sp.]|nr:UDP-N-acetylmuramoylalanyl-D-glutamyl-2,6-diaminopimelate--D-alanyl-D-alanine ligase [Notoacmeibacter sp.]
MSFLWTSAEMVEAMGGRPVGTLPEGVTGISIDTRSLARGDAFFAIKGENFDGHDFASNAMAAGAGLLVISESKLPALLRLKIGMIVVDDVLAAMGRLAAAARKRFQGQVIAVTGSAGKTTTKEALRHVLSACGTVHASAKSFNNHWGVPLSLARLPRDAAFGVFEIGMNHPGEITPLAGLVQPHVAIVTLIAAAHLGHFKNLDQIAHAKAEIFTGIVPGGYALLNRDDAKFKLLDRLAREAGVEHVQSFGENPKADYRLVDLEETGEGSQVKARVGAQMVKFAVGAPGRHMVQNALAVMGAVHLTGADIGAAARAFSTLQAEKGRGERHVLPHPEGGSFTVIDESYNANPASMRAALKVLQASSVNGEGRRIAVLGDMLELGSHSAKLHCALAEPVLESGADALYLGGPEIAVLRGALPEDFPVWHFADVSGLKEQLTGAVRPGDVIMIKSSNGIGFSKLVDALRERYAAAA